MEQLTMADLREEKANYDRIMAERIKARLARMLAPHLPQIRFSFKARALLFSSPTALITACRYHEVTVEA